jgi:hypothetical protein
MPDHSARDLTKAARPVPHNILSERRRGAPFTDEMRSCFDARRMFTRLVLALGAEIAASTQRLSCRTQHLLASTRSARGRRFATVIVALAALIFAAPSAMNAQPEPSLAGLLQTHRPAANATDLLSDLLAEIEKRPYRTASMMQASAQAHAAIDAWKASASAAADVRERRRLMAWAALSWADRAAAWGAYAAVLQSLTARVSQSESAADDARAQADAARQQLAATPDAATNSAPAQIRSSPPSAAVGNEPSRSDEKLAPDFAARAETAARLAARETRPDARRDLSRRAQLLAAATADEAERIRLERRVQQLETRLTDALAARASYERAKLEAERTSLRTHAAQSARSTAEHAFAWLAGERKQAGGLDAAQVADFLSERAEALLAAAVAIAGEAESAAQIEAQAKLAEARAARGSQDERVHKAEHALTLAARALGDARQRSDRDSPAQTLDLLERARERGLSAEGNAEGVTIHVANGCAVEPSSLSTPLLRRLQLLRDVLSSFPRAGIHLGCANLAGSHAQPSLARTRAAHWLTWFAENNTRARFSADASSSAEPGALQIVFSGYVSTAPRPSAP